MLVCFSPCSCYFLCPLLEGTLVVACLTGGFMGRVAGSLLAMPATTFYPCRSALRPMHLNLLSPTGDPLKPGTGSTLLLDGGTSAHPGTVTIAPDQSSTRRNRRSAQIALVFLVLLAI